MNVGDVDSERFEVGKGLKAGVAFENVAECTASQRPVAHERDKARLAR